MPAKIGTLIDRRTRVKHVGGRYIVERQKVLERGRRRKWTTVGVYRWPAHARDAVRRAQEGRKVRTGTTWIVPAALGRYLLTPWEPEPDSLLGWRLTRGGHGRKRGLRWDRSDGRARMWPIPNGWALETRSGRKAGWKRGGTFDLPSEGARASQYTAPWAYRTAEKIYAPLVRAAEDRATRRVLRESAWMEAAE